MYHLALQDFIERKTREYANTMHPFDASDLNMTFAPYFRSNQRIKIETCGMIVTGTVSVTTGWKPVFILMRRSSDHGSSWTLGANDKLIAVQHGRQYREVTK